MKTSNRLLFGLLAAIVIYFSLAFVELRLKGDYNHRTYNTDSVSLPTYSHLVIKGLDQRVYIKPGNSPKITTRTVRENAFGAVDYQMKGDTLVINDLGLERNDQGQFTIYSPGTLKSLTSVDSYYQLHDYRVDSLVIEQHGGQGSIQNLRGLNHLALTVKWNGEFDVFESRTESVDLYVDQGNVEFRSPINSLTGSMVNDGYLSLYGVQNFNFKKDETSRLRIFE